MLTTTNNITSELELQAKTNLTNAILEDSARYLKGSQLMELNKTLNKHFQNYEIFVDDHKDLHENYKEENKSIVGIYIRNKELEGISPRTITYYKDVIIKLLEFVDKPLPDITTQDIREFLACQNGSNVTIDNYRRNLSAFFGTISNEGYIQLNPMAKIKKIKASKKIKKPYTELEIEKMRHVLNNLPEHTSQKKYYKLQKQVIFELLLSSGIRLRELHQLNKSDMNLVNRTFIVLGKGNKERTCYFSVKCQFFLKKLFNFDFEGNTKKLENLEPLLVNPKTGKRLGMNGIERNIRNLGRSIGVEAHPHKFRRTFATTLVNKGVPIEQIKELLGHSNIDTTMLYAIVDQDQVRYNHNKFAG